MIPISKPYIDRNDQKIVTIASKIGWGSKKDYYIEKFEKDFKKKIKIKYSIATSSCTGALTLALSALNLKPNSEVILADINWIASVSAIYSARLKPVFIDIDKKNWCISPESLERTLTKNTKAVIVTHLYGNAANIKKILKICKKNKIYVIEDAAEALGSKIKNKYLGTFGHIGCFSFHGTKTITTGEGGMVVTNNKDIYKKIISLNSHGVSKNKQFYINHLGYKFKMTNIQAALGISQLKKLDKIVNKKRKIFFTYKKYISSKNFFMNDEKKHEFNSYWMPTIVCKLKRFNRNKFQNYLKDKKVDTRVFFYPISSFDMFKKSKNLNSYSIYKKGINLPSYYDLKLKDVKKISEYVNKFF